MLDALSRHELAPQQLVLSSSRAVYGEGAWGASDRAPLVLPPIRSHHDLTRGIWEPWNDGGDRLTPLPHDAALVPARPANVYAATKLAQENLCSAWAAASGTSLSILRLQNVYGPGQSLTNSYTGIVTLFARIAAEGGQIQVYEDGNILRDFVYIDDVVRAFARVIELTPESPQPIDIGSGLPVSILGLAETIAGLHEAPAPVITGAFRDGDVRAAFAGTERAKSVLGWSPQQPLKVGLKALFLRISETFPA